MLAAIAGVVAMLSSSSVVLGNEVRMYGQLNDVSTTPWMLPVIDLPSFSAQPSWGLCDSISAVSQCSRHIDSEDSGPMEYNLNEGKPKSGGEAACSARSKSCHNLLAMDIPYDGVLDLFHHVPPRFEEQFGAGVGAGSVGGAGAAGPLGVKFIPILSVSERYDSNIFFTPKIAGLNRADYITSVSPQLFIRDNARAVATTLQVGAVAERYVNNPTLSYIGYSAGINFGLTGLIGRIFPGVTLNVSDNFSYTPNPPAFLGGGSAVNNQLIGEEAKQELSTSDTFSRGIQASRVNTTTNSSTISGGVPVSASTILQATYTYAFIKFGAPVVHRPEFSPVFFGTDTHIVSIGPQIRLSEQDLVSLAYGFSRTTYTGKDIGYDSHSATSSWQHYFSRNVNIRVFAGAAVTKLDTGGTAGATSAGNSTFVPTGGASLGWATSRTTSMSLSYTAGVYPSYQTTTGPLYSHVVSLAGTQRFTDSFGGQMSVNYARNDALGKNGGSGIFFDSYTTNVGLYYRVASWAVATLNGGYGYYRGNLRGVSALSTVDQFDRTEVSVGLTTYWQ